MSYSETSTFVLLPGNMCDRRLWRGGEGALLRALDGPQVDADLSQDDSIDAMAARTLASYSGRLIPVGFSMGGIVALEMARQAPERIAALALIDTNPGADLAERAAQRPRQQGEVRAGRLEQVVVGELKPNYLAAANRKDAKLLALLRDMALSLGPDVFVRQSEALRTRAGAAGVIASLDVPIFVACGAEDRLCPPEWHQAMAAEARRADLHVITDAGHMLPLEQPQALARALGAWCAAVNEEALCRTAS